MWSTGKRAVLWVAGRASVNSDTSPGTLWTWPDISRGGHVAPRDACGGGACLRLRGPASWPETTQPRLRTKAISWGPPRCSSIRKGGPLYGWKNRGIFAVVGTGRRGLRVCSHVGQLLAPRPSVSVLHGRGGPLMAGCRRPAGLKGRRGHSPGERGHPGKCPALAPVAPVASLGSCRGAWSRSPGPRFTAGECLLRTPRTTGRGCLHGEGGSSSVGPGSQRTQSLLWKSSPDFRE